MSRSRQAWRHAARVAFAASITVVACYVVAAIALNVFLTHRFTAQADTRLRSDLVHVKEEAQSSPAEARQSEEASGGDIDDAPSFLWRVTPSGATTALTAGAPQLPARRWTDPSQTLSVGGRTFRFDAKATGSGWIVAGESLAELTRVQQDMRLPEILLGFVLLGVVFTGSLLIGLRASAPIEALSRRQSEFTADASHELRTPLGVIEAEVSLAMRRDRTPEEYEEVLQRISKESGRLRRIVEDLLWLARADETQADAGPLETVDLAEIAARGLHRFDAVAERLDASLDFERPQSSAANIEASTDLLDRLVGVLVDNACKFAGPGGHVLVAVRLAGNRVILRVDDSGLGIAPEDRNAIFDRFHRATENGGGAGLGLAIADSVVRRTHGVWSVGSADLGGARMEISWRRSSARLPRREAPMEGQAPDHGDDDAVRGSERPASATHP